MHFEELIQKTTGFWQRPRLFRRDLLGMDLTVLRLAHLAHFVSDWTLTQKQATRAYPVMQPLLSCMAGGLSTCHMTLVS